MATLTFIPNRTPKASSGSVKARGCRPRMGELGFPSK